MSKNFLILRTKIQSQDLVDFFDRNNQKYFVEPIFKVINKNLTDIENIEKFNIAILTSYNAILGFLSSKINKNIKIFVLSQKIADELIKNGYKNIEIAQQNNANSLEKLILSQKINKNDNISYFCGNFISKDFSTLLEKYDLKCKKILAYEIVYNNQFTPEFLKYIKNQKFDYVLCYSKNIVRNLKKLIKTHNLVDYFNNCKIMGFSDEIVTEIKNNNFENFAHFKSVTILKDFYNF